MIAGRDVDKSVAKLYAQYKRAVSIGEVANDLNVSVQQISRFVTAHLRQGTLEGDPSAIVPGSAMGLI